MKKILFAIFLILMLCGAGYASPPGGPPAPKTGLKTYTVATIPSAAGNPNMAIIVTDGNTDTDCETTGGGTTRNICISDGSNWVISGDGAAGITEADISDLGTLVLTRADATATYENLSPSTQTIQEASEGTDSTPGTYTLTPTAEKKLHIVKLSTLDPDGETVTVAETGAAHGNIVTIWNGGAYDLFFPWSSAGVEFTGGGDGKILTVKANQSITLLYATDRWIVIANESSTLYIGAISTQDPTVGDPDTWTMSGNGMYGGIWIATAAGSATLPTPASGMNFMVLVEGAYIVTLAVAAGDTVYLDGAAETAGEDIVSSGTSGDRITCFYRSANALTCTSSGFDGAVD